MTVSAVIGVYEGIEAQRYFPRDGGSLVRSGAEVGMPLHPDSNVRLTMLVHELIGSHTLGHAEMRLPYSITVENEDRQIAVSGRAVIFHGARIVDTPHWIGEATVDDVLIRVTLHDALDVELRPCPDPTALSDRPPRHE